MKEEKKIIFQTLQHEKLLNKMKSLNKVINKELDNIIKEKKKNKKNKKSKKRDLNNKTTKSKCKPWQECWIKESGYDPQKDVQNIYYGFYDSCQTALHPLEGCNPKAAVYFTPPPQGF